MRLKGVKVVTYFHPRLEVLHVLIFAVLDYLQLGLEFGFQASPVENFEGGECIAWFSVRCGVVCGRLCGLGLICGLGLVLLRLGRLLRLGKLMSLERLLRLGALLQSAR